MEKNRILKFELSPQNLKIKNILMNDFICIDVYAISDVYPNRNNSHFTKDSMIVALPTFYDKPALGSFDVKRNDFGGHDAQLKYDPELEQPFFDYTDGKSEVPLGTIRQSDTVEIVERDGQNWVHFTCALWAKYGYRQIKRLLKDGKKKISVEIEVLKSHKDEQGIDIIDEFIFDGFTILGSHVTEAIPNAAMTIIDKIADAIYQKQEKSLSFAYSKLEEAQGLRSVVDNNDFSDDSNSIDNEDDGEITMEIEEKGEEKELTYEQKRELLERWLNDYFNANRQEGKGRIWIWIADMTDTVVYYNVEEKGCFSALYNIELGETEEAETVVIVDVENAKPVIRSWEEYSENPENVEEAAIETYSEEEEPDEEQPAEEPIEEPDDEEGDEDGDEDDEDEEDDDEAEESAEEEPAEENHCDEPAAENYTEENLEESGEVTGEKISNANVEHEAEIEPTEESIEETENELPETEPAVDEQEAEHEAEIVFDVDGKNVTAQELYSLYSEVAVTYSALLADYESLTSKFNELQEQVVASRNTELYAHACGIVDGEEDLESQRAIAIKTAMKENCDKSTYSTIEEVAEATEHLIADALYAQKKMSKKPATEEFAANFNKPAIIDEPETDAQRLKKAVKNLRKI